MFKFVLFVIILIIVPILIRYFTNKSLKEIEDSMNEAIWDMTQDEPIIIDSRFNG